MKYKIVSDSSSNVFSMEEIDFTSVPLKINSDEKEYVDRSGMNVEQMIDELQRYKGRSGSSCPNPQEWLQAFGGAQVVFAVTISSNLSGSYSSATQAAQEYCALHPDRRVYVVDSLTAGPEMQLILEKLREGILAGQEFEALTASIQRYQKRTATLFCLKSLNNLARNGRVKPAAVKLAGVLGIQVVGGASDMGTLEMLHKCRGENRALNCVLEEMKGNGYCGGRVIISQCRNPVAAGELRQRIRQFYPRAEVEINRCGALCSFYAENGGMIIGYEKE